ncbi:hypothetical protein SOVF_122620 [Spinacia oleracea]|nr:hypothetical protein SOVF_122620 [Spinacia oleracea]
MNFSNLHSEIRFPSLERLVARCKSLRVLKLNKNVNLEQLQRLLIRAPWLTQLGTDAFSHEPSQPSMLVLKTCLTIIVIYKLSLVYGKPIHSICLSFVLLAQSCHFLI